MGRFRDGCESVTTDITLIPFHLIPFHFIPLRIHTHTAFIFQIRQSIVYTRNPMLSLSQATITPHQWICIFRMRRIYYLHLNYNMKMRNVCAMVSLCRRRRHITQYLSIQIGLFQPNMSIFLFPLKTISIFTSGKNDLITISKERQTMSFIWLHLMLTFAKHINTHTQWLLLWTLYWILCLSGIPIDAVIVYQYSIHAK